MRRSFTLLAVLSVLALVASACSSAKDTGFPPILASSSVSASPSASIPTTPVTAATLIAKNIQWDLKQLLFQANAKITVTVDNQDSALGVPHDFGLFTNAARTADKEIFKPAKDTAPGEKVDYVIPALKAGTYYFQCDIHPSMNGTATVK
jgi:plastocyanin